MDKSLIMLKCKSCEGEYKNILDDGMEYYHACAPIEDQDGKFIERPDARNENVGKEKIGKGVIGISIIEE